VAIGGHGSLRILRGIHAREMQFGIRAADGGDPVVGNYLYGVDLLLPFGAELVRFLVQVCLDTLGRCETAADAFLADQVDAIADRHNAGTCTAGGDQGQNTNGKASAHRHDHLESGAGQIVPLTLRSTQAPWSPAGDTLRHCGT